MTIGLRQIGYLDIPGGGQIFVKNDLCAIGHMAGPEGTSLIDVSDPRRPSLLSQLRVPSGTHSHKVRLHGDLMLVNNESETRTASEGPRGLRTFDISNPRSPREISFFPTYGRGVHRFDFDGRHAFISTTMKGFKGNILLAVDLERPEKPKETWRWWLDGQWVANKEEYSGPGRREIHHALRFGSMLLTACCNAGWTALDISDMSGPKVLGHHPLRGKFTHTVIPLNHPERSEPYIVAVEEGWWDHPDGGVVISEVSDWTSPRIVSTFDLPVNNSQQLWAAHQPTETAVERFLFVAWFAHGLRVLDLEDPANPTLAASYMPEPRTAEGVMTNDVFVDRQKGIVYLIDRNRGLEILEIQER